jgi:pyruvate dehydrogenase (quinone)/pyruvate oxidase
MVFLGNPEYGVQMTPIDFVRYAEACGGRGVRIEDAKSCRDQLAEALAAEGPMLIEAVVDPYEPPMPPKVKTEQAKHMAEALARGEPNRDRIALTLFRNAVGEAGYSASPSGVGARIAERVSELLGGDRKEEKEEERRR